MKVYKIFRTLARISLLPIIFGFFQPIACGFSGPDIVEIAADEGSFSLIFPSSMLIISALLSIVPTIRIMKKSTADLAVIPLLIILALISAFISARDSFGSLTDLITYDKGATLIASAVILSIIFSILYLITGRKEMEKESLVSLIEETNSALISAYEKRGYEQKEREEEDFTIPQNDGTPYWTSKSIRIPSGVKKLAAHIEGGKCENYGSFASSLNINGRKVLSAVGIDAFSLRFFDVKESDEVHFDIAISGPPASSYFKGSVEFIMFKGNAVNHED